MVVEGRGNNRGEEFGVGHGLQMWGACLDTEVKTNGSGYNEGWGGEGWWW